MLLGSSKLLRSNAAGGGLPPDNGFGLLSLTTTRSGTFQANNVTKTGAPLRWWWGDGTYTDGNNPVKVYPDNSEKTIYIATTDGWSGLTDFRCSGMNITSSGVSVATALTRLYLQFNNLTTTPPDTSANTSLTHLYLHYNNLTTPPDTSANTSLTHLHLHYNNLTTPPGLSTNTALIRLLLDNNSLDAVGLSAVIDDCYTNRAVLGSNGCNIQIQSNAEPPNADTVAKIEGTGIYAGDGLKDNGCLVTY